MSRLGALALGLSVTSALAISGCSAVVVSPTSPSAATSTSSATTTTTASSAAAASDLDTYLAGDAGFYERLRLQGALIVRPPNSLRDLRSLSSVVVAARVVDVRAGGSAADPVPELEIILQPTKVLYGQLHADRSTIRVSTLGLGPSSAQAQAQSLSAALPGGESVWFLRWQGDLFRKPTKPNAPTGTIRTDPDLYAFTHPYGLLVQGPSAVATPLVEPDLPPGGFVAQTQSLAKVSQAISAAN